MTLLNRIGNKDSIANNIIDYFPKHKIYIEMFFGAGGIFFNKDKVKYNVLNDLDSEIFNFFMVIKNNHKEFKKEIETTPLDETLFKHWKINNETDNIKKAIRFIYLSNFCLYGKLTTMHLIPTLSAQRKLLIDRIDDTYKFIINDTLIINKDFRKVLSALSLYNVDNMKEVFVYADPPYIDTCNCYNSEKWKESDFEEMFYVLLKNKVNFAISELNSNYLVINLAKKHRLKIIPIANKRAISTKKQEEILIVNYKLDNYLF